MQLARSTHSLLLRAPARQLLFPGRQFFAQARPSPNWENQVDLQVVRGTAREEVMVLEKRVGFLGAGQMAEALARGFLSKGVVSHISVSDPSDSRKDLFRNFGCIPRSSNAEVVSNSDIVFLAVKPDTIAKVLQEPQTQTALKEDRPITIVSIAAGLSVDQLLSAVGSRNARMVRVMPNTPCLVGETASAMCLGGTAGPEDESYVHTLFSAVGKIFTVEEKLMSAVTGLSGSGPAYVFMMIEALADGGVRAGLPRPMAQTLAAQTVYGGAKMVLESGQHPGQLKDNVTSPGGTTITAVHELEKAGMRAAFMNAVIAASNKADEMGKPK
ncbi:pyrroline-5-carboxylate reductase [Dunaliella salina]|uniref:Pyrroline-5-carboxylate reductase n=1 Tax=Dunaliella salina TaxID=3046 RepID=A0ABQ7FXJ3_DUNSA|nr:pyrroline-5-carboxylate reductase [Dunaliella salina]|eukprot:KAF5827064.1 pyrroline-5-carboxylate reductase [Dunaliella salina]